MVWVYGPSQQKAFSATQYLSVLREGETVGTYGLVSREYAHEMSLAIPILRQMEEKYDPETTRAWMKEYWTISLFASVVYVVLTFAGQRLMKHRQAFHLRRPLIIWNIALCIFSTLALLGVTPNLLENFLSHGIVDSFCRHFGGYSSVWSLLFALSKVVELLDTAFIVLRKSPLIVLHWYHHASVMIWTWYYLAYPIGITQFCLIMNCAVHSVMYLHYALRAGGVRISHIASKMLTSFQLLQMFLGVAACLSAGWVLYSEGDCFIGWADFCYCMAMYISYAVLFMNFFYHRYVAKGDSNRGNKLKMQDKKD